MHRMGVAEALPAKGQKLPGETLARRDRVRVPPPPQRPLRGLPMSARRILSASQSLRPGIMGGGIDGGIESRSYLPSRAST